MSSTVLVVDDSEAARTTIRRAIEDADLDVRVIEACDGAEALSLAMQGNIDIVLSDIVMPKLDGIGLLRAIRQKHTPEALPVILVTSHTDGDTRLQSFENGVNDYLTKPFSSAELVSRIQVQLRLRGLQDELKRASERYKVLGTHDELTGLANRRHFFDVCRRELARSRRHQFKMSVVVLDVDLFRQVNNRVGYLAGDAIINEMGMVLDRQLRSTDVLARLGGAKFSGLLPQTDVAEVRAIAGRLVHAVKTHSFPQHDSGEVTISVGAATYPNGPMETVDELVNAAESALDRAKSMGGSRVELCEGAAVAVTP